MKSERKAVNHGFCGQFGGDIIATSLVNLFISLCLLVLECCDVHDAIFSFKLFKILKPTFSQPFNREVEPY